MRKILVWAALLVAGWSSSFSLAVRVGGSAQGPGVVTPAEDPTRPIGG